MIFILLAWVFQFAVVLGFGFLLWAALRRTFPAMGSQALDLFQIFWLGLGLLLALLQIVSLFAALDDNVLLASMVLALLGLPAGLQRARASRPQATTLARLQPLIFWGAFLIVVLLCAAQLAVRPGSLAGDSYLYHFSWVRWANEYPAVPGLANLHCRLGMNSAFLLYSAWLDNLGGDQRSAWFTQGFFIIVACAQWLRLILAGRAGTPPRLRWFCLFTLPYLLLAAFQITPGLYYDRPAHILQLVLVLVLELLRIQTRLSDSSQAGRADFGPAIILLLTLALLGFLFKPSGALSLLMTTGLVALLLWRVGRDPARAIPARRWLWLGGLLFLLPAGYLARNGITSGWLFYPAPAGRLPAPWAVPEQPQGAGPAFEMQSVAGQCTVIRAWARAPGPDYARAATEGFSFWFPRWYARCRGALEWRLLGSGIVFAGVYFLIRALQRNRRGLGFDAFLPGMTLLNLCFWFWSAPDFRFGEVYFWIWMSLGAAMLLTSGAFGGRWALGAGGLLFLLLLIISRPLDVWPKCRPPLWALGWAAAKPTQTIEIPNGQIPALRVHVPLSGDQCGDAELPCTPYPLPALRAICPGRLAAGFWIQTSGLPAGRKAGK